MPIEIKRLTPDLANDYLAFFDRTPHDDGVDEHKCYCVCWSGADCEKSDDSTAENRRSLAGEYVRSGALQGYFAYEGDQIVGWCNANAMDDCLDSRCGRAYLRPMIENQPPETLKIKFVFCFVIAPEYRRKGVAGALLERVCEDAKADGYDVVQACPLKTFVSEQYDYAGPAKLYEKAGFTAHLDLGDRLVMRKAL